MLLYFALMAFSRSVVVHLWWPRAQMERAQTLLAQTPTSVCCLALAKRRTKSRGALRALVAGRKYALALPAVSLLALSRIFRVRLVRGNLIALKQLEKMIQNIDSKHLITV